MTDAARYERYLKNLPVIPEVATKIMGMAEDGMDISFKELENIIKIDPGLTAKILRVANSALYARQREITNLQMAITLLGFKNIKSLVMLVTASSLFPNLKSTGFYQTFWRHSVNSAFLARHVAARVGQKEITDEGFLAGLLHDIGQTAFFHADKAGYEEMIGRVAEGGIRIENLEREKYGLDHRELGAALLARWYFPDLYVDVAREHESLNITSRHKSVILVVSAADLLAEILGFGYGEPGAEERLRTFQPHLSLSDEDVAYYRSAFREDVKQDSLYGECQELFGLQA